MRARTFIAACALLLGAGGPATAEKRVALVVGNAAYRDQPLRNPVNDARAVAGALREAGFEVLLRENAGKQELERAIADFGEKLGSDDIGLFYYAGHGIQARGQNYLVPVDAQIRSEARLRIEAVDADLAIEQMAAAGARVSLVVLDACRNNPFERRFRSGGEGGLAQIRAPAGTLIAYATAPGRVAADGDGANSIYSAAFVSALRQPGLAVEDVFKQVRVQVSRATHGQQVPWELSSLTGEFVFRPGMSAPATAAAPSARAPRVPDDPEAVERALWEAAAASSAPDAARLYLERYPHGRFAAAASARLAAVSAAHDGRYRGEYRCSFDRRASSMHYGAAFNSEIELVVERNEATTDLVEGGRDRYVRFQGTVDASGGLILSGPLEGPMGQGRVVMVGRFADAAYTGEGRQSGRDCTLRARRVE